MTTRRDRAGCSPSEAHATPRGSPLKRSRRSGKNDGNGFEQGCVCSEMRRSCAESIDPTPAVRAPRDGDPSPAGRGVAWPAPPPLRTEPDCPHPSPLGRGRRRSRRGWGASTAFGVVAGGGSLQPPSAQPPEVSCFNHLLLAFASFAGRIGRSRPAGRRSAGRSTPRPRTRGRWFRPLHRRRRTVRHSRTVEPAALSIP